LKYLLFADLYFPQGILNILVPVLIPIYLAQKGIPVEIITIVAGIGWAPWIIKFSWSGVIDKYLQYGRKIFVIIGSLIAVLCFFILAFIDPAISIIPFAIVLFISQIGQSFHDSAADAWAIDISLKEEHGKINAAMSAGISIGISSSAVILSFIAEIYGFNSMFLIVGIIVLLMLVYPLVIKEIKVTKKIRKQEKITPLLISEFRKKTTQLISLFALSTVIGGGVLVFVFPLFATNVLGLSVSQMGLIAGVAPLVVIPGYLVGGVLSDRWGRKKTIYIFAIPSIVFIMVIIFTDKLLFLLIPYLAYLFLNAGHWTTSHAMYMDETNPKIGATQFAMFNSLTNLGIIGSGMFAGTLIALLGYYNVFFFVSLSFIPPLIILYFIKLKKSKNNR